MIAETTRFSFGYRHPARPDHLYSIAILFDRSVAPDRYRLEIRDAEFVDDTSFSSGPLIAQDLKAAVEALALVAHITSADRGRHNAGRQVYRGWCRPAAYRVSGGREQCLIDSRV
jgi:hypothetical protein